jgi:hypothetical protein
MDLLKELAEIDTDQSSADNIINDIENQKYELSKKSHILKILALCNQVEKIIDEVEFKQDKIKFLKVYWEGNAQRKDIKLGFYLLDSNKKELAVLNENYTFIKSFSMLSKETDKLGLFDPAFKSDLDPNSEDMILDAKLSIKEKLLNILLSKELKSILDYNRMQLNIPENENTKKVRMKI